MLKKLNYKFLFATALAFGLINSVDLQLPSRYSETRLELGNAAVAKGSRSSSGSSSRSSSSSSRSSSSSSRSSSSSSRSSPSTTTTSPARASSSSSSGGSTGGRVSGGSFKKPAASSSPIRAQTTTNPPQPTSSQRQTTRPYQPQPVHGSRHIDIDIELENDNPAPYPVVPNSSSAVRTGTAPVTVSESANASDNGVASLIAWGLAALFLLSLSAAVILLVYFILKQKKASGGRTNERENDIVTVSQLQVALLATAQGLQSELSELTLAADTETSEGLCQLLQESVLVLLRNSHNWTHVLTSSQSVRSREEADVLFTKLSIEQRSKFSAETLVHVRGKVNHKDVASYDTFNVSADYIVVTLLVGTADDKPLFGEIRSVEALKDALQKVASIPSDYLMAFELVWSPQKETDTLTYEQLLTNYTDMFQIA
ncbi:MAG TPA: DUF1517 domain-containing protein [Coleofasciculaceae cyanobacterium]